MNSMVRKLIVVAVTVLPLSFSQVSCSASAAPDKPAELLQCLRRDVDQAYNDLPWFSKKNCSTDDPTSQHTCFVNYDDLSLPILNAVVGCCDAFPDARLITTWESDLSMVDRPEFAWRGALLHPRLRLTRCPEPGTSKVVVKTYSKEEKDAALEQQRSERQLREASAEFSSWSPACFDLGLTKRGRETDCEPQSAGLVCDLDINGKLYRTGFRPGDALVKVNDIPIRDWSDWKKAEAAFTFGKPTVAYFLREGWAQPKEVEFVPKREACGGALSPPVAELPTAPPLAAELDDPSFAEPSLPPGVTAARFFASLRDAPLDTALSYVAIPLQVETWTTGSAPPDVATTAICDDKQTKSTELVADKAKAKPVLERLRNELRLAGGLAWRSSGKHTSQGWESRLSLEAVTPTTFGISFTSKSGCRRQISVDVDAKTARVTRIMINP